MVGVGGWKRVKKQPHTKWTPKSLVTLVPDSQLQLSRVLILGYKDMTITVQWDGYTIIQADLGRINYLKDSTFGQNDSIGEKKQVTEWVLKVETE